MQALCCLASSFTGVNPSAPFRRNIPWNKPVILRQGVRQDVPLCSFLHKHNGVQPLGAEPLSGCLCLLPSCSAGCLFSGRGTVSVDKGSQNRACLQGQSHGYQAHLSQGTDQMYASLLQNEEQLHFQANFGIWTSSASTLFLF